MFFHCYVSSPQCFLHILFLKSRLDKCTSMTLEILLANHNDEHVCFLREKHIFLPGSSVYQTKWLVFRIIKCKGFPTTTTTTTTTTTGLSCLVDLGLPGLPLGSSSKGTFPKAHRLFPGSYLTPGPCVCSVSCACCGWRSYNKLSHCWRIASSQRMPLW